MCVCVSLELYSGTFRLKGILCLFLCVLYSLEFYHVCTSAYVGKIVLTDGVLVEQGSSYSYGSHPTYSRTALSLGRAEYVCIKYTDCNPERSSYREGSETGC